MELLVNSFIDAVEGRNPLVVDDPDPMEAGSGEDENTSSNNSEDSTDELESLYEEEMEDGGEN